MRPKVSLGLPSTMSWEPKFSKCTLCSRRRNWSALSTFSRQWILILPLVGLGSRSPESISSNLIKFLPSLRSVYKSVIRLLARTKCELTHLQNVFFWTDSLSSNQLNKHVLVIGTHVLIVHIITGQSFDARPLEEPGRAVAAIIVVVFDFLLSDRIPSDRHWYVGRHSCHLRSTAIKCFDLFIEHSFDKWFQCWLKKTSISIERSKVLNDFINESLD